MVPGSDKYLPHAPVPVIEERVKAIERLMDERDRLYLEKFRASEIAVAAAITAAKEQTSASFASSEKAIGKAEQAQSDYNNRSNEFRGQLDDQAKTLMPRTESQTLFKSYEDKLEDMKKDITSLRESRSVSEGSAKTYVTITGLAIVGLQIILHFWK
jgi:hypothetical protein